MRPLADSIYNYSNNLREILKGLPCHLWPTQNRTYERHSLSRFHTDILMFVFPTDTMHFSNKKCDTLQFLSWNENCGPIYNLKIGIFCLFVWIYKWCELNYQIVSKVLYSFFIIRYKKPSSSKFLQIHINFFKILHFLKKYITDLNSNNQICAPLLF